MKKLYEDVSPSPSPASSVYDDEEEDELLDECNALTPVGHSSNGMTDDPRIEPWMWPLYYDLKCFAEDVLSREHDAASPLSINELLNGTDSDPLEPITEEEMNQLSYGPALLNYCQSPQAITSGSSSDPSSTSSSPYTDWLSNMDENETSSHDFLDAYDHDLATTTPTTPTNLDYYSSEAEGLLSPDLHCTNSGNRDQFTGFGLDSSFSVQHIHQNQNLPAAQYTDMYCESSTSAEPAIPLRSLLETQLNSNQSNQTYDTCAMTEFRRVPCYYPPMGSSSSSTSSTTSTSSSSGSSPSYSGGEVYYRANPSNNQDREYQLRIVERFVSQTEISSIPDASKPNVNVILRHKILAKKKPQPDAGTPSTSSGPGGPTRSIKKHKKQPTTPKRPSSSTGSGILGDKNQLPGTSTKNSSEYLHHCSFCSKGFNRKDTLKIHFQTHTGEKPFKCNVCQTTFRQKSHLRSHFTSQHMQGSQKEG